MKRSRYLALVILLPMPFANAVTLYYVPEYASEAQSPFLEGISNGQITFTNFESGQLAFPTPGDIVPATPPPGVTLATPYSYSTFSVDGDDGSVDGIPPSIAYSCLRTQSQTRPRFIFNFTADSQGHYPRYFGIAFVVKVVDTDINSSQREVIGAKDAFGADILTNNFVTTPTGNYPVDSVHWAAFFGFYSETGISQVTFKNAACLDHLQYGYSIPEPSLLWVSVLALAYRRRRSHDYSYQRIQTSPTL